MPSIRWRENAVDERVRSMPQLQTNFPLGTLGTKEIARVNDALLVRRERRNDNTRVWLERGTWKEGKCRGSCDFLISTSLITTIGRDNYKSKSKTILTKQFLTIRGHRNVANDRWEIHFPKIKKGKRTNKLNRASSSNFNSKYYLFINSIL